MNRVFRLRGALAAGVLALAPVALLAAAAPAAAQGEAPLDPAYSDLVAAIEMTVDQERVITNGLNALQKEFAATEAFAEAEALSPGLIAEVTNGLRPILTAQNSRVQALYRPRMVALFARSLTPDEAKSVAAFYRSDIGRKLVGNVANAYTPDATLSGIETEAPVTADQVRADLNAAVESGIDQLSADDRRKMIAATLSNPALLKLEKINPSLQQLRVEMENEPLTAEEDAALVAVVEGVFARRFPAE